MAMTAQFSSTHDRPRIQPASCTRRALTVPRPGAPRAMRTLRLPPRPEPRNDMPHRRMEEIIADYVASQPAQLYRGGA